eukprot:scaffold51312_cov31-Attheya_sp.AAC.1
MSRRSFDTIRCRGIRQCYCFRDATRLVLGTSSLPFSGAGTDVGDVVMLGGAALVGGHLSGAVGGRRVTFGKYSMCGMSYYAKADDLVEVGERIKRARMEDQKDPCLALIAYPLFGIAAMEGEQAKKLIDTVDFVRAVCHGQ